MVGWREWIALPDFGITTIKAKVDTGARTSSLHAFDMEVERRGKLSIVRFKIHPEQRTAKPEVTVEAPIVDWREVKPSSGHVERRPVITTTLSLLGVTWEAELTLTRRDEMGFRMLLGRQALRRKFVVDPGRSFLGGRRIRGTRKLKKRTGR